MIGLRIEQELRDLIEELAEKENRTLSGFVINAVLTYRKENGQWKVYWSRVQSIG